MPDHSISLSMYTTNYIDKQPLKVELHQGQVNLLIGGGLVGTQHIILPPADALVLAQDIIAVLKDAVAEVEVAAL